MPPKQISLPYKYTPRSYQLPLWKWFERGGRRAAVVWHRRAGKDLLAIHLCVVKMMQEKGLYWHLLPTYNQGRKIVWDGYTYGENADNPTPFLDAFPKELVRRKNATDMMVELKNGSKYQVVGCDDVNRLVGANPRGCVFSEYSIQDPAAWNLIRPILSENGGWALFIYTSRGRNHGYSMLQMANKNPKWFSQVLIAGDNGTKREDGTPVVSDEAIQDEIDAGMPQELVDQEYYCSFETPIVGAFYGSQMEQMRKDGRICNVPWENRLPVHTAWDIGVGDCTAIIFFQVFKMEVRIIDYLEKSGEGLPHFVKLLNEKPYIYGKHYAPFDMEVREWGSGGLPRRRMASELGVKFTVLKRFSQEEGIEMVRATLSRCWIDEDKCDRLIEAMRQFRKEWDEKRQVFKKSHIEDWTYHAADAFKYMASTIKTRWRREKVKPVNTINDYNPLAY